MKTGGHPERSPPGRRDSEREDHEQPPAPDLQHEMTGQNHLQHAFEVIWGLWEQVQPKYGLEPCLKIPPPAQGPAWKLLQEISLSPKAVDRCNGSGDCSEGKYALETGCSLQDFSGPLKRQCGQ